MSRDYFENLPPELMVQLSPLLSLGSVRALVLTCHRLHAILQPELEAALTDIELVRDVFFEAVKAGKIHTVAKLLAPPCLINPDWRHHYSFETPLYMAVRYKRRHIAALLLEAGADVRTQDVRAQYTYYNYQPLHLAAFGKDLEMMKLLLEHGAPVDSLFISRGIGRYSQTALHYACELGIVEMGRLLLDHGADLECGVDGTALGWAALGYAAIPSSRTLDMVFFLLKRGANTEVPAPFSTCNNLLYASIKLPFDEPNKLTAVLLAYGASRDTAMEGILLDLTTLALEAKQTEDEYLAVVTERLNEAEKAIPSVLAELRDSRNV